MNYYEPRFLRGVIEKALPLRLFFRNRFFSEGITFPTETVSFEFASDSRRLLPYTGRIGDVPVDRDGYSLKTFTPPLLSGSRVITPDTLASKLAGESPWNSGDTAADRAQKLALRDLMELQDALFRKEEYMCARVKQDGKLDIKGKGINAVVEYGFENIEVAKTADKWTASYDVIGKLREKAQVLRKAGVNPDMLICGADASKALMENDAVMKLRHDELVNVPEPSSLPNGVNYVCRLRVPGLVLDVYEYLEYYYDDVSRKTLPLVDDDTVIMQSSREQNMMLYGAVTVIGENDEYESVMGEYVPNVYVDRKHSERTLTLSSRALPMPRDIGSWYVLKNVA